jgi:hypothetical protein
MQTYAKEKTAATRKELVKRIASQSEWPFRVQSYQFKTLEDARKFSRDLAASPKACHRHHVGMFHRHLETAIHGDGYPIIVPILLDVTTDSPEEAEAKYADPTADTAKIEKNK